MTDEELLSQLPTPEAAIWHAAKIVDGYAQRMVTRQWAGLSSSANMSIGDFIKEANNRLLRWRNDGNYEITEAAQVIADSNPHIDATTLRKQMEEAVHKGSLTLRENGLPVDVESLQKKGLWNTEDAIWNMQVRQDDVNEWLSGIRAGYALEYPYDKPQPPEVAAPVVKPDPAWGATAQQRAVEIIERQRKLDLYPPQGDIADEIAKEFRTAGVVGAGGKPLTGAYIKRHALKGISSEHGKQLSTSIARGK